MWRATKKKLFSFNEDFLVLKVLFYKTFEVTSNPKWTLNIAMDVLNQQAVREAATICPAPCKLTFDLLTLKVVSESRVTWATNVPILVFLGLSVLDLGPNVRDRQTSDAHHRLMPPPYGGGA